MKTDLYPLQVLLLAVSGRVNRHQQKVIEYLVEENRVLADRNLLSEGSLSIRENWVKEGFPRGFRGYAKESSRDD